MEHVDFTKWRLLRWILPGHTCTLHAILLQLVAEVGAREITVKHLSESADVRLLCYPVDASLSLRMTKYSEEIATSGNALLAMTV